MQAAAGGTGMGTCLRHPDGGADTDFCSFRGWVADGLVGREALSKGTPSFGVHPC
jgi:hypothetical protein